MYDLSGKTALVTGGGRGIGRATAMRLAQEGATVVVVDLHDESARSVAEEVRQLGVSSLGIPGDVASAKAVEEVARRVNDEFGGIDILVNNAGISRYKSILECSEKDWDDHVDIMAKGSFLMMRAFAGGMIERKYGRIVNLGSYVAQFNCAIGNFGPYTAAKFAIVGLTQSAAQEFAPHVTVNAVGPGDVATEMMEAEWQQEAVKRGLSPAEIKEEYRNRLLLQEFETPNDIASAIVHLCSDEARHVTGAHHIVGGGLPFTTKK